MEGDKLIIKPEHTHAAGLIAEAVAPAIAKVDKYTLSVGGESGAGKSEVAVEVGRLLGERGIPSGILQMDDYFIFPSRTCHEMRMRNIEQVGMYEARLDFIDCNLRSFKQGDADIYKPLSIYAEDRLTTEVKEVGHYQVLIAEGTYTTALSFVDCHVFLDRTFEDSRADREARARDILDDTMNRILDREHGIVSQHKALAEIVVAKDFSSIEVVKAL